MRRNTKRESLLKSSFDLIIIFVFLHKISCGMRQKGRRFVEIIVEDMVREFISLSLKYGKIRFDLVSYTWRLGEPDGVGLRRINLLSRAFCS